MTRSLVFVSMLLAGLCPAGSVRGEDNLLREFITPPDAAKAWCYWWWLNGAASKEGITRDFQEMKKQGIAGALLFDAGEAGPDAPRGPHFMSPQRRELYKHALHEADRLGIVLSVNLCSGWNAGGPWVTPEHAAKKIVGAATTVKGPGPVRVTLPQPEQVQGFYRDIAVLACPVPPGGIPTAEIDCQFELSRLPSGACTRWAATIPAGSPTAISRAWARRPRNPSISSSITTRPGRPPGCTCTPYAELRPEGHRGSVFGRRENVPHAAARDDLPQPRDDRGF